MTSRAGQQLLKTSPCRNPRSQWSYDGGADVVMVILLVVVVVVSNDAQTRKERPVGNPTRIRDEGSTLQFLPFSPVAAGRILLTHKCEEFSEDLPPDFPHSLRD